MKPLENISTWRKRKTIFAIWQFEIFYAHRRAMRADELDDDSRQQYLHRYFAPFITCSMSYLSIISSLLRNAWHQWGHFLPIILLASRSFHERPHEAKFTLSFVGHSDGVKTVSELQKQLIDFLYRWAIASSMYRIWCRYVALSRPREAAACATAKLRLRRRHWRRHYELSSF